MQQDMIHHQINLELRISPPKNRRMNSKVDVGGHPYMRRARVSANSDEDLSRLLDHRGGRGGGNGWDVLARFLKNTPRKKGASLYLIRLARRR